MRPPLIEMILSQFCYWSVALLSGHTAWKFFKSVDGRMRVLTIRLFSAICFVYTLAGSHYLLYDLGVLDQWNIVERIICSGVMLWACWFFWGHLR